MSERRREGEGVSEGGLRMLQRLCWCRGNGERERERETVSGAAMEEGSGKLG